MRCLRKQSKVFTWDFMLEKEMTYGFSPPRHLVLRFSSFVPQIEQRGNVKVLTRIITGVAVF